MVGEEPQSEPMPESQLLEANNVLTKKLRLRSQQQIAGKHVGMQLVFPIPIVLQ